MTQATYETFTGTAAEAYEQFFVPVIPTPLAADLLDAAALEPGERVLDVACGTGIVTRLAAAQVGPQGTVVGADVAPDMLELAGRLAAAAGVSVDWEEANAEKLPFANESFDVVLSQLGYMFVEDRAAAASEMRRVLTHGGRCLITVPGRIQAINEIMDDALASHISPDLAGFVQVVFSLHDPDELAGYLTDAGFTDVEVWEQTRRFELPAPARFLWEYVNSTPMATFVAQAGDEAYVALEADVTERWEPFVEGDGMAYDQPMVFARARR